MANGFVLPPGGRHRIQGGGMTLGPPDQAAIIELRARYDIEQLTSMIPDRRRGSA